jgi:hypothetical protein
LLLYVRLFSVSRRTRCLAYGGLTIVTLFYTSWLAANLAFCVPRAGGSSGAAWSGDSFGRDRSPSAVVQLVRCSRDREALLWTQAIFSVVSDAYVLAVPLQPVWQLQMPLRRKVAVSALFLAGLLYVIVYFLRLPSRILGRGVRMCFRCLLRHRLWVPRDSRLTDGCI